MSHDHRTNSQTKMHYIFASPIQTYEFFQINKDIEQLFIYDIEHYIVGQNNIKKIDVFTDCLKGS